jgi:hypothetical protein
MRIQAVHVRLHWGAGVDETHRARPTSIEYLSSLKPRLKHPETSGAVCAIGAMDAKGQEHGRPTLARVARRKQQARSPAVCQIFTDYQAGIATRFEARLTETSLAVMPIDSCRVGRTGGATKSKYRKSELGY